MSKTAAVAVAAFIAVGASACTLPDDSSSGDPKQKPATSLHAPMRWGNWEVIGKVHVEKGLSNDFAPEFNVKNTGDEDDTGEFRVRFYNHGKLLGKVDCTTRDAVNDQGVKSGETRPVYCEYGDTFKKGTTEVRIGDAPF
ncbi:MAG: hypothetical protein ACTHNS_06765 [Marmoricola sp.]